MLFKVEAEVAVFAQLHNDIDFLFRREGVVHLHDVRVLQTLHKHGFLRRLVSLSSGHSAGVNLFEHIYLVVTFPFDLVNYTERTLA